MLEHFQILTCPLRRQVSKNGHDLEGLSPAPGFRKHITSTVLVPIFTSLILALYLGTAWKMDGNKDHYIEPIINIQDIYRKQNKTMPHSGAFWW